MRIDYTKWKIPHRADNFQNKNSKTMDLNRSGKGKDLSTEEGEVSGEDEYEFDLQDEELNAVQNSLLTSQAFLCHYQLKILQSELV